MFETHDHIPQAIIIVLGVNSIGAVSKAQMPARAEDMITDCMALWDQACPQPQIRLGLFILLVPPCLWYSGFLDQRAGREARQSLNSHFGKICKLLKATVIPHPHLTADKRWFHDPKADPITLSEPGYDLFLQDICISQPNYNSALCPHSERWPHCTDTRPPTSARAASHSAEEMQQKGT